MYVTQARACTVPNSNTPITPAQLAAGAARVAAADQQFGSLLQKWMNMLDRTPESFKDLNIAPSEFVQPQNAVALLNLDRANDGQANMDAYRAGAVCNPVGDGPLVVPLNGGADQSLPLSEPVDLLAKGPLGRPQGNGMAGYQDLQPHVAAQRIAARRRRMKARAGLGCACHGKCGGTGCGMGAVDGSPVLWGSLAAAGFLMFLAFGNKPKRR